MKGHIIMNITEINPLGAMDSYQNQPNAFNRCCNFSLENKNINLLVEVKEKGITKVSRIHGLGKISVCTTFYRNPSDSC